MHTTSDLASRKQTCQSDERGKAKQYGTQIKKIEEMIMLRIKKCP
jgi:hypothetical protein